MATIFPMNAISFMCLDLGSLQLETFICPANDSGPTWSYASTLVRVHVHMCMYQLVVCKCNRKAIVVTSQWAGIYSVYSVSFLYLTLKLAYNERGQKTRGCFLASTCQSPCNYACTYNIFPPTEYPTSLVASSVLSATSHASQAQQRYWTHKLHVL